MASFQIALSPSRRAATRFIGSVRTALQQALKEEKVQRRLDQSEIAEMIDVHRSVISRQLNGKADISLARVAELAWAMGREIEFSLPPIDDGDRANAVTPIPAATPKIQVRADVGVTSGRLQTKPTKELAHT